MEKFLEGYLAGAEQFLGHKDNISIPVVFLPG